VGGVQNCLNLNAVPASWQEITLGSVIILAVGVDMWRSTISHEIGKLFKGSHSATIE